jgi:DNA-directed RNA polymerase specialized sigma24 family protein
MELLDNEKLTDQEWMSVTKVARRVAKGNGASHHDAKDVAQITCMEIMKKDIRRRPDGTLYVDGPKGETELDALVGSVAKKRARDLAREERRRTCRNQAYVCGEKYETLENEDAQCRVRRIKRHAQALRDDNCSEPDLDSNEMPSVYATVWGLLSGEYVPLVPVDIVANALLRGQLHHYLGSLLPEQRQALTDAQSQKSRTVVASAEGVDRTTIAKRLYAARLKFIEFIDFMNKLPPLSDVELLRVAEFCNKLKADGLRGVDPELHQLVAAVFAIAFSRHTAKRNPGLAIKVLSSALQVVPDECKAGLVRLFLKTWGRCDLSAKLLLALQAKKGLTEARI